MSDSMRTVPLEQAVPGMVLAEDLRHHASTVLLPRAVALTERHIANLRARGIREIRIVADADDDTAAGAAPARSAEEIQALRKNTQSDVQRLFRHSGNDAVTEALYKAVLEYRLEKIE